MVGARGLPLLRLHIDLDQREATQHRERRGGRMPGPGLGSVPACTARPFYPRGQTSSGRPGMSVSCPLPDSRLQKSGGGLMETLLSFVPRTSCASCSWFFQATPKSYRDDPVFQSAAPGGYSAGGRAIKPAKPKPGATSTWQVSLT